MASYEKYLNINWINLNKMTAEQLRESIKVLAPIANRNVKSLGKSDVGKLSPAYQQAIEREKSYGVRGIKKTDVNKLRQEYSDINKFLTNKASSLRKFNKMRKETFQRIAPKKKGKSPFEDINQEKEFWRIYRKVEEESQASGYGSLQIQQDIVEAFTNKESIIQEVNNVRMNVDIANSIIATNNISVDGDNLTLTQYNKLIQLKALEFLEETNTIINEKLELEKIDNSEDGLVELMLNRIGAEYEYKQSQLSGYTEFI